MCGIVGIWGHRAKEDAELCRTAERMVGCLRHRGPDDSGIWVDKECGLALGHARLSIIDLSAKASQPMVGPSGQTVIILNGEIYNYLEERKELEARGVKFKSESDTEVILALYEQHDLKFLDFLRGMFAFALWDMRKRQLILARGRLGKKPLYYSFLNGNLYFGSEIKSILSVLEATPRIDADALDEYLSFGFISGRRTIYEGIEEMPQGHVLKATSPDEVEVVRYWEPRWTPKRALSLFDAADEAEELLTEAVRLRLRADVPVGVFLSGGIDSGLVTGIASKVLGKGCVTFSVGFEGWIFDERPLARQVAQQYETDHHEIVLEPDVVSLIPKIAWHHDEPFADPSAIPSFAISEYARRYVKVVLNGDGGDELFAGYRRHLAAALLARLRRLAPEGLTRSTAGAMLAALPAPRSFRTPYAFFHRFLRGLAGNSAEEILWWYSGGFTAAEKSALYRDHPSNDRAVETLEALIVSLRSLSGLDRAMAIDLLWELPGDLLVKMDVATMAYGLEARSPFLDQELVEWANLLPEEVRLGRLKTKPLLRELAKRYLPDDVVQAPKRGFEVPLHRWLQQDLREARDDLILARGGIVCSLFDRSQVEGLLRKPNVDPGRWTRLVWILLMLAAWERYSFHGSSLEGKG